MEDRFSEKPLPPAPTEANEDAAESGLSHREKNAQRAFRATVFSLLFFPLLPYAYWLLYRVYRSHGRLAGPPRRHAILAAVGALAVPVLFAGAFIAALLTPKSDALDLRNYPHPVELVGIWTGAEQTNRGEVQITLELRGNAHVRFREAGATDSDSTGYWCYTNHSLFLQIKKTKHGGEDYLKRLISWSMVSCKDNELLLDDGKTRLKRLE